MTNIINIINSTIAQERYWSFHRPVIELSGHMNFTSPFESSDSCNTCDGARCDYCEKVVTAGHFEFSVNSDELFRWMLEANVPENVATEIAFGEGGYSYNGYRLKWPTEETLAEEFPEFYNTLTSPDGEVMDVIESFRGQFDTFHALREAVFAHFGLDKYCLSGHVYNQMEMYWCSCGYDHKKACTFSDDHNVDTELTADAELTVYKEEEDNYPDSDYMYEAEADAPEMDEDVSEYDNYGDLSQDLEYGIACINLTCQGYDVNNTYYYTTDGFGKGTKISIHKFMSPADIKKATEEYIAERKAAGDTKMENWVSPDVVTTITVLREEMVDKVILDLEVKGILSVDEVYV